MRIEPQFETPGHPITGYWPEKDIQWNDTGLIPRPKISGVLGRYGWVDDQGKSLAQRV